jgi:cold shock CspA family protein
LGKSANDAARVGYTLSPLARMYIQKFIRPNLEEQRKLIKKQNELRSAQEEYSAKAGTDVVDMNNVFVRDKDDYIVARILTKAIALIFKKQFFQADPEIERARDLSPNYFEVYRVSAAVGAIADGKPEVADQEVGQLNESELPANRGKLVHKNPTFAFIETGGARFFFHKNFWRGEEDFGSVPEGAILEFGLGKNAKGICAINVRPISDVEKGPHQDERKLGAVTSVFANYGFVQLDAGGKIFFHRDTCTAATKFKSIAVGDRVRVSIGKGADGRRCAVNVELYSGV